MTTGTHNTHIQKPNPLKYEIVKKLLGLAQQLLDESEEFLEQPENQQLWYNRGYSVGILKAIKALHYEEAIPTPMRITLEAHLKAMTKHRMLPWGKTYCHGEEKGSRETFEVLGNS